MQALDPVVEKKARFGIKVRSRSDPRLILSNKFERFGLKIRIIYK